MLHLLYLLVFAVIAFLTVSNLIRSLITVSMDFQRRYIPKRNASITRQINWKNAKKTVHPELLDEIGNPINEPLLVMRSMTVEDARQQLDTLYDLSPSQSPEKEKEKES